MRLHKILSRFVKIQVLHYFLLLLRYSLELAPQNCCYEMCNRVAQTLVRLYSSHAYKPDLNREQDRKSNFLPYCSY